MYFLERAIELNRNNAAAHGMYAMALKKKGKFAAAIKEVSKGLEIDSEEETLYYNRACYKSLLKFDEADIFTDLERAFDLLPGLAIIAKDDEDLGYVRGAYQNRFGQLLNSTGYV